MRCVVALGLIAIFALDAAPVPVAAHPGGMDKQGCHTNRKTGEYHCHGRRAAPPPSQSSNSAVYYPNCDAVRAAGKAPLKRGDPGYRAGLDRDGDGFACEYSRFNPR